MIKKIKHMFSTTGLRWLWIMAIVFIVDRITKTWVYNNFIPWDPYPVTHFFNITLAYNKGAAFSFLNGASGWQGWLFGCLAFVVSLAILHRLRQVSHEQRWLSISLTLIIAGALGNLFDRILYGHVIDFIDLYVGSYHWPVFNLSDAAICVGATMLFIDVVFLRNDK